MKKTIAITLIILLGLGARASYAQTLCELPTTFNTSFSDLDDEEKSIFKKTTTNIVNALSSVVQAINEETITVMDAFQTYSVQKAAYDDAVNKMAMIKNRQVKNTENQMDNRPPDFDDRACARATNAKNWAKTRQAKNLLSDEHKNGYLAQVNKAKSTSEMALKTRDAHVEYFSDINEEEHGENPFLNADVNANSIFAYSTFHNIDTYEGIPSTDYTSNTLIAAQSFAKNLVGNTGVQKVSTNSLQSSETGAINRAKQFRTTSRQNLAYSTFADSLAKRTALKDTKTGVNLRAKYSQLDKLVKGNQESASADMAKTIHDDISEYEFKDHMYSKMLTNPDWIASLETPNKSLQLEQLDIVNKNMALEWDMFLTLEKLATIDGANLAATLDNNE